MLARLTATPPVVQRLSPHGAFRASRTPPRRKAPPPTSSGLTTPHTTTRHPGGYRHRSPLSWPPPPALPRSTVPGRGLKALKPYLPGQGRGGTKLEKGTKRGRIFRKFAFWQKIDFCAGITFFRFWAPKCILRPQGSNPTKIQRIIRSFWCHLRKIGNTDFPFLRNFHF